MSNQTFKIGDVVAWESQSQSSWTRKSGTIVAIVPDGGRPDKESFPSFYKPTGESNCGLSRVGESYVVMVEKSSIKAQRKPKFYWPRVSALRGLNVAQQEAQV